MNIDTNAEKAKEDDAPHNYCTGKSAFNPNSLNIMLDIETTGLKPGCKVIAIGAVAFTIKERKKDCFFAGIDRSAQAIYGLTEDVSTMKWWSEQSAFVQAQLISTEHPIASLGAFSHWYNRVTNTYTDVNLWHKGCGFDTSILGHMYEVLKLPVPWHYRHPVDYRTLIKVFGHLVPKAYVERCSRQITEHTAIGDAWLQADICHYILNELRKREILPCGE